MVFYCFCICGRLFWPWVVSAERLLGSLIISRESDVRWVCVWERKKGGLVCNRRGSEYCTLLYERNSKMCKCVWACLRLALRTSGYPNQLSWWWDERMWRLLPGNCFQSATVLLYLKHRGTFTAVCVWRHLCSVPKVEVLGYVQEQNTKRSGSKRSVKLSEQCAPVSKM